MLHPLPATVRPAMSDFSGKWSVHVGQFKSRWQRHYRGPNAWGFRGGGRAIGLPGRLRQSVYLQSKRNWLVLVMTLQILNWKAFDTKVPSMKV